MLAMRRRMRIGKDELGLMSGVEVGGDSCRLPANEDQEPEHEVEKHRGKDKNAEVHAPFGSSDDQCCSNVTCEHNDLG